MTGDFHVLAVPGGWSIQTETDPTPVARYELRDTAIQDARVLAMQTRTSVIIHGIDGNIEARESFREPTELPSSAFGTPNA
ncbi:hypothetical protein F183_A35800 [Bryobacterales bacterium F-183]|nr:hypothetical protein F183_A35800 [Bryobacterales bacterium F-183]